MQCLKPNIAWRIGTHTNDNGDIKDTIVFSYNEAIKLISPYSLHKHEISLPCGKCEACLKNKRLEQSIRITHEIEAHEDNCFITLTYNPDNLPYTDGETLLRGSESPSDGFLPTLNIDDYQRWLKRFRKQIKAIYGKTIRYFIVGEYGTKGKRPHYHAIIFGWKPDDLTEHKFHGKYWTYRSKLIEKTWTLGFSEVGIDVNAGVAKYCAQYVTKKFTTEDSRPDFVMPEFVRASKMNGGIGSQFVHKFHKQLAEQGYVLTLNRHTGQAYKSALPRYYRSILEKFYKTDFDKLKSNKECYIQNKVIENLRKTSEDWYKHFDDVYNKIKVFREMQRRQVRKFEQTE